MWQVGCTLLWARTVASTLAVLLTGIQGACGVVDAVSCPSLLELLIQEALGRGQTGPQALQVVGFWLGRIFVSAHPPALPASLALGALG